MKKLLGLTLLAVAAFGISTASAQKFARINSQEIVFAMPELTEIQKNLEALEKDWAEQLEQIQVEFNNKMADYEKNQASMAASIKQMKAQNAINKIAKASGYLAVFESASLVYFDEAQLVDIAPLVKKELGIVEKPATAPAK